MRRYTALFCLAGFILALLYWMEYGHVRQKLRKEQVSLSRNLLHFQTEDFEIASSFLQTMKSSKGFASDHAGNFRKTLYSKLGLPTQSFFPPIPPAFFPEQRKIFGKNYWVKTRWFAVNGKLWVETLVSSHRWPLRFHETGSPILGFALWLPKEVLVDSSNFHLLISGNYRARRFWPGWLSMTIPGQDALDSFAPKLFLNYRVPFAVHFLFWGLALSAGALFIRFLRHVPQGISQRELQLEDELAYLSRTYQDLSKSLRLEHQRVESILNSAPDGIFTCGPDGMVRFWNRSMENLIGIESSQVVGKHYREILNFFSSSGQLLAEPFSVCFGEGKNFSLLDARLETVGLEVQRSFPVALGAAPVQALDGGVHEVVITVKDIQVQKEAEHLKRDIQTMITHDLRSPLSAMLGYAGLVQNAKLCKNEEDAAKYMEALIRTGKGMHILIGNLLGLSGIEGGKLVVHKEPVLVTPILKEVVESVEILAKPKNITLRMEGLDGLWAMADGEKLKEILVNLMTNAIKFSRSGETVRVSAAESVDKVKILVSDRGPGISDEEKAKLFEKFSTLHQADSGTGLGLFIVKTVAGAMDGEVEVESEVGKGSIFIVTLPAIQKVKTHSHQLSLLSVEQSTST